MRNWSKQEIQRIHDLRAEGKSWDQVNELVGATGDQARCAIYRRIRRGWSPEHDMTKEVPEGYVVKGTSTLYDSNGEVKIQWVKSDIDNLKQQEMLQEMLQAMAADLPRQFPIKIPTSNSCDSNTLSAYLFGDPHIGMLSWEEDAGENFDLKIAEDIFQKGLARLVQATPTSDIGLLVNLGDFFHRDGIAPITSRSGNMLDVDGRYARMVQVGVRLLRFMIDALLLKHQQVHVINAVGNHDTATAMFLSVALHHIYEKEPRLTVDINPSVYNYYLFGKNLIGVHHGHSTKAQNLPGVMASDKASDWGTTKFRYWWTGHIHHQQVKEYPGVTVESFNTLAAKDEFHHSHGYRSQRSSKAIVLHKKYGEIERHIVNTDMLNDSVPPKDPKVNICNNQ